MESFSPEFSVFCHSKVVRKGGDSGDVVEIVFNFLDEFDILESHKIRSMGLLIGHRSKGCRDLRSEKQRNYPIPLFIDELEGRDVVPEDVVTRSIVADVIGVGSRNLFSQISQPAIGDFCKLINSALSYRSIPSCRHDL
jgi:hypothetical protein